MPFLICQIAWYPGFLYYTLITLIISYFFYENNFSLSFRVGWDGIIYGYVRGKKEISTKLDGTPKIIKITVTDWDDRFLMVFEGNENEEIPFFVTSEEVRDLLETCRRVPEQYSVRKPKKN